MWKGTDSEARLLAALGLTEVAAQAKEVEAAEAAAARQHRAARLHGAHSAKSCESSYRVHVTYLHILIRVACSAGAGELTHAASAWCSYDAWHA